MPFMRGAMPLRRTLYNLGLGRVVFRDEVQIFTFAFNHWPNEAQKGARDFVYWHWSQLLFKNPQVQFVKLRNVSVIPFALAFLKDGREVPFDLEWKSHEEIVEVLQSTLGNTALVQKRDYLESMLKDNPADFGSDCERQCICEVQGQHPCSSVMYAPKYLRESNRWHHKNYKKDWLQIHPKNKHLSLIEEANVDRDRPEPEMKLVSVEVESDMSSETR